jgi:hypothetical protein
MPRFHATTTKALFRFLIWCAVFVPIIVQASEDPVDNSIEKESSSPVVAGPQVTKADAGRSEDKEYRDNFERIDEQSANLDSEIQRKTGECEDASRTSGRLLACDECYAHVQTAEEKLVGLRHEASNLVPPHEYEDFHRLWLELLITQDLELSEKAIACDIHRMALDKRTELEMIISSIERLASIFREKLELTIRMKPTREKFLSSDDRQ